MGFERVGFRTVWANDFDKDSCATHRLWSKADVVCGDISKIDAAAMPNADVVLGGFPCQGFSLSGPRKIDDGRNRLYKEYVRVVRTKRPAAFVGENVKGLLTMAGGTILDAIKAEFSGCGYDVFCQSVNAKDYGVPQHRERVFIVGFRKDLGIGEFSLLGEKKKTSLLDALAGMPPAAPDEVCRAPFSSRYMSRNRKRGWSEVSYTIPAMAKQVAIHPSSPDMVKLGTDSWRFGEGGETRRLSYRECAAIQTFPADMEFAGDLTSKYRQIGNAVPVRLAECAAKAVYAILAEKL
jgi:DNA (cytosine-5)-methyltransferase 1